MLPLKDNVPTRSFPVVTVGLILANVIVWLWELHGGVDREVIRYGYYPCSYSGPCTGIGHFHQLPWYEGAFSSMFMHASWGHIAGNMLFFWIFGNNVEDALGRVRFFLWYVACGLAATTVQTLATLHWGSSQDASIPNIGASGAIAGVLGAYFLLLPRARVLTLIFWFFVEVPAVIVLGGWFAFQLWEANVSLTHPSAGGGVALFAHIGGFVFGLATVRLVAIRRPLAPRW